MTRIRRPFVAVMLMAALTACSSDGTTLPPPVPTAPPPTTAQPAVSSTPTTELSGAVGGADGLSSPQELPSVAVVGDSLTVAAEEAIVKRLNARGAEVVALDAESGRRIRAASNGDEGGVATVAEMIGSFQRNPPDVWVVALGTNDIGGAEEAPSIESDMRTLLEQIDDTPVLWIDTYDANRPELTASTNQAIDRVAAEFSNVTVVRWSQTAPVDGLISNDGVHLTDAGEQAFALTITNAVIEPQPTANEAESP